MRLISWGLWGAMLVSVTVAGCGCDCKSGSILELPKIDASTAGEVRVSWQHDTDAEPRIVCSWQATTSTNSGWSCSPTPLSADDYGTTVRFSYDDATPSAGWHVAIEAPGGSLENSVPSYSTDPGEGWPGECICYDYRASLPQNDLTGVGVKLKP